MSDALADCGAVLLPGLAAGGLDELAEAFAPLTAGRVGLRLPPQSVAGLASVQATSARVRERLGPSARVVRALLFDKAPATNWALGWHQDRVIEVRARVDVDGFGPWTVKAGRPHVAPPVALLAGMLTARLHLDPVDGDNAPLLIAPGSHRQGLVPEHAIAAAVAAHGRFACHAMAGDVWLYATLILHASERAARPRRRRVLQLDYSAASLPGGLAWAADE